MPAVTATHDRSREEPAADDDGPASRLAATLASLRGVDDVAGLRARQGTGAKVMMDKTEVVSSAS